MCIRFWISPFDFSFLWWTNLKILGLFEKWPREYLIFPFWMTNNRFHVVIATRFQMHIATREKSLSQAFWANWCTPSVFISVLKSFKNNYINAKKLEIYDLMSIWRLIPQKTRVILVAVNTNCKQSEPFNSIIEREFVFGTRHNILNPDCHTVRTIIFLKIWSTFISNDYFIIFMTLSRCLSFDSKWIFCKNFTANWTFFTALFFKITTPF